jgi:LytS/YehU family sensor histidine kinase
MSVQTVVENSVKYAVGASREGSSISITATRDGGRARVLIADDGPGFDASSLPRGHGLALLRDRLALLLGRTASLEIESASGTTVTLTLPADQISRQPAADCEADPAAGIPPLAAGERTEGVR